MSYPPPQGPGYPPYGAPPQGYPQQSGYGQPPPHQYPPQGHSPYPQQPSGYPPPASALYGAPQYGVPPPAPYGSHQPQQYPPPGAPYGAAPAGYPPQPPHAQATYGQPPHQPYGASPGQYPPPQQPPQSQYHAGAPHHGHPTPPSPGYVMGQTAPGDATREAEVLYKAMKGFGTDEAALIRVLSKPDPLQMALIRRTFDHRYGKRLDAWVESETSGYFKDGLVALVRGPLEQDVHNVTRALDGLGTKETLLNDVVLSRSNADLNAIKQEFYRVKRRPLEDAVRKDLSMKTERMFAMVMAAQRAEESAPVISQQTDQDVTALHRATEGQVGADQLTEFSGHMEDALLMIVRGGMDRAMRDAMLLEEAMKGAGTKDDLLVNRIVRYHWDRNHMNQVKGAYRHRYGKELASRIRGETRGDYEKLMLACIE
ncbi:MAG: hypothetical protein M1817_004636 [Caeruleum heppii]|nr:MAG: hypothetical protein M1817_004636 [Caeruleum heppii]